jgi:hypothetical protein
LLTKNQTTANPKGRAAEVATVTRFEFVDDIDGKPLDVEDVNVVQWAWLGVEYEFETSTANLDRIENGRLPVSTLLAKSRRTGGRKKSPSQSSASKPATSAGGTDTKAIREWAQQNGYEVSDRGRIPANIVEAFTSAH